MTTVDVAFHGGPERLAVLAREAERRGHAGGLFVPEGAHDPYIDLAVAATVSDRVTLGTGIAVAFARTPMATAYSAWDVQRLSHGRFILGLGTQIKPHITRRFSMPWSAPAAATMRGPTPASQIGGGPPSTAPGENSGGIRVCV